MNIFHFIVLMILIKTTLKEVQKISHNFKKITISLGWKEYADTDIVNLF